MMSCLKLSIIPNNYTELETEILQITIFIGGKILLGC